jgi:hypothetical protein
MAPVAQMEAAVVRPWTLTPSLKITPAPRKPIPAITPCARRVGSSHNVPSVQAPGMSRGAKAIDMITAEASATNPWVRRPATRPL